MGQSKGKDTKERMASNFGMPHPEGYRKALQKMKLAEKFDVPVICVIDTPGAYPGIGAEERGQAMAIAVNLMEMSASRLPRRGGHRRGGERRSSRHRRGRPASYHLKTPTSP